MKGDPRTLKEALHNTIHNCDKSVAALAEELGMGTSYLYRAGLPDGESDSDTGVAFQLKMLIPLIRATGNYEVLNYIERSLHRIAIPYPTHTAEPETMQRDSLKATKEFGELMGAIYDRCKDGKKLTRKDRETIFSEGWDAIEAIMCLIVACEEGIKCQR